MGNTSLTAIGLLLGSAYQQVSSCAPRKNVLSQSERRQSRQSFQRRSLVGLLFVCCAAHAGAAEPADNSNDAVIHLVNGDHITGRLVNSPVGHGLTWQSPAFTAPLRFATRSVNRVQFPMPAQSNPPEGAYRFELAGRDNLFGSLVELQGDEAVLDVSGFGRLHVERAIVRRISRWRDPADLVYSGPNGLDGWRTIFNPAGWREESRQLVSDKGGASTRSDVGVPSLARIELELSWKARLDFEFGVGGEYINTAFRFTVWENQLVIVRETERGGDIAVLQDIGPGPGRIHLQAFLDQPKGRLLVFSSDGRPLADLTVVATKPQSSSEVQLIKPGGDIRLERLTVDNWNGEMPRAVAADESRIHMADGSMTYGRLKSFDATRREFVIENHTTDNRIAEQRIPESRVRDIVFAQNDAVPVRSVQLETLSGQRISGELLKVERGKIWLKSLGIREELAVPVETLRSLLGPDQTAAPVASHGRIRLAFPTGRLELPGTILHGGLVETEWADINRLVWKPALSQSPSPLQHGLSARILYREPQVMPTNVRVVPVDRLGRELVAAPVAARDQTPPNDVNTSTSKPSLKPPKPVLYLHSGDRIACDSVAIDETGVTFTATRTDITTIRHDQLRGIELVPGAPPVQVPRPKLDRLLSLPRRQRDNPPTHLIQSVDGDCLRGRLVSMDGQQLRIEIRLETKTLQRDRVARIIWLQSDGVAGVTAKPQTAIVPADRTRVQVIYRDGNRLTFLAEQLAGPFFSGRSELLGDCRVDLQQIDQLLIGPAVDQPATTPPFGEWKLKPAAEPVAAGDGDGQESELVGKLAPDFALDRLDGTKFRLSDHRGRIVVLDFWASWCGPCLQTMPQIDKVVREFSDQGVDLVAINLEETNDRVQATLDRLKLQPPVVLDRTGRTAAQYGATSIPQTVIIDRNGKVVRLFVGGGAKFGDQLRTALQAVVSDKP